MQLSRQGNDAGRDAKDASGNEDASYEDGSHGDGSRQAVGRRRLGRPLSATGGRAVAIAGVAIAVAVAPVALATGSGRSAKAASARGKAALVGGIHNPAYSAFSRTTGLFANTKGWVTRIKNQGSGGAATLPCKAATGRSCLEAANNSTGFAFTFISGGATGGTIQLKNPEGAPFTTNAHGVATGLNANYLQGKQASEFQLASQPAANAEKLGGQPASSYVTTGQVLFATVNAEGKLVNDRGARTVSSPASGTYTVAFGSDVSKCSYTAAPVGAALTEGQIGVGPTAGNADGVNVYLPGSYSGAFDLQVDC